MQASDLLRIADAIEARADEFVKAESQNTGKPIALTASEEVPPMVDQIRFFAGAARMLEGRSAGEYLRDHTSMISSTVVTMASNRMVWSSTASAYSAGMPTTPSRGTITR